MESGSIIILGAGKLCRQTYCLRQREAMYKESTATGAIPRRSVPAPSLGINCVLDELLRSIHSTGRWKEHE
jgi:hypothetical protein